jgi:hypothetical protein
MAYAPFGVYWVWSNQSKVTFDGDNKLILVNPGVTGVLVESDIYSNWKESSQVYDYLKYDAAMRNVGGDPINVEGDKLGATFFLINGWKIRTWEGNHNLSVIGNLYSDDGLSPFVSTLGDWNITITTTVSNLIDKVGLNALAGQVWDQVLVDHQIGGSTGKALKDALKIVKVLLASA